jgi:hypothetical protein
MNSDSLVLTPAVAAVIRAEAFRAWRGLHRFGFEPSDIRQEFAMACIGGFHRYDASRSSPGTFAGHTCRQRTMQMIEPALAAKRNRGAIPESLSAPIRNDEGAPITFGDLISDDDYTICAGLRSRPAAELAELRIDVSRAMKGLPADMVAVAELLAVGERPVEIARRLGICRASVYRTIPRLRDWFVERGLDGYIAVRQAA